MMQAFVKLLFVLGIMISFLYGCREPHPSSPARTTVHVVRVVDTFVIQWAGKFEKVRLIGMDTPETVKPHTPVMFYGKEASAYSKGRLNKQTVTLEWDIQRRDQYGRLLAYVWIGKEMLNETLIKLGYARLYTFPPDVKYVSRFKRDQQMAENSDLGIWKNFKAAFAR